MSKRALSEDGQEESDNEEVLEGEMPTGIDPYAVLAIDDRTASQDDIKRAYRKAALKHHPDKAAPEDKGTAHTKFQEIAFAFAVLSDERRRKRYDTTGSTEESLDIDDDDFNWRDFFREQYETITEERIDEFSNEYKGSDEERGDVLKYYEKHKGNMRKLYEEVMLSDMVEDEDRFREIIDAAIDADEVKAWPKYTQESESARRRRIADAKAQRDGEAEEAEEAKDELDKKKQKKSGKSADADGGMGDLAALIQSRQKARAGGAGGFLDHLEAKYAPKGKKGGRDEPPEEAFAKNAKKPAAKRAKK